MKSILLAVTLFVLSLFIVSPAAAVTKNAVPAAVTVPVVKTADAQKSDYLLPYPGLLPDSPLYSLKQVRDRILEFLIADPVRKIEFYLLQADKRLGMGVMLAEKGKDQLAETTISKGTKYMNLAVSLLSATKASGRMIPGEVTDRLSTAIAKHKEVLESLIAKANGATAQGLKGSLTLLQDLSLQIGKLK